MLVCMIYNISLKNQPTGNGASRLSNVVEFRRTMPTAAVAKPRVPGIASALQTYVSQLKPEQLTSEELNLILHVFDSANDRIRAALSAFGGNPEISPLIEHSLKIKSMIEIARRAGA